MPDGGRQDTVRAALDKFRALHGIDGRHDETPTWPFAIGPVTVAVPNFSWRRAAIRRHDIHHLLTGFPFNMRGEFQVATWEFAAGRYPHIGATLMILPLVFLGLLWSPRAIWRAFLDGRRSFSLYRPEFEQGEIADSWTQLRRAMRRDRSRAVTCADRLAFARVLLQSAALVLAPILGVVAALALG